MQPYHVHLLGAMGLSFVLGAVTSSLIFPHDLTQSAAVGTGGALIAGDMVASSHGRIFVWSLVELICLPWLVWAKRRRHRCEPVGVADQGQDDGSGRTA